jgi:hypothetical protein
MGVSTKNLMARTGHDNKWAALHYQHRSANGDHIIADGLDALVRAERDQDDDEDRGAAGALVPVASWPANGPSMTTEKTIKTQVRGSYPWPGPLP